MKGFKGSAVKSRIPKYADLRIDENDLRTGTIYSGPFEFYSDDELREVLDEVYLYEEWRKTRYSLYSRDSSIFKGKLVHYDQVDEQFNLPPGTAKKLLQEVASRYKLVPEREWQHSIRFKTSKGFRPPV